MSKPYLADHEVREFYRLCVYMDEHKNVGWYDRGAIGGIETWIMHQKYLEIRRGILFYSTGFGWRVRKKPHWKTVFAERFGAVTP